MLSDLHCHTKLSDGSLSIDDLVFYAKRAGLDFVAITDHDTMAGVTRAHILGKRFGIGIVSGVELSAMDYSRNRKVHILCYLPQKPDRLEGIMKKTLANRTAAGKRKLERIMKMYPITAEHVARYSMSSQALYDQHIMQAIADLGYTSAVIGELSNELFRNEHCMVESAFEYPDVLEVLDLVHSSGGIAVMAHPGEYHSLELLEELADKRLLDGVEYFHPCNTDADKQVIGQLAYHYNLIITGGTDFHGQYSAHPNPLGSYVTPKSSIDRMFSFKRSDR